MGEFYASPWTLFLQIAEFTLTGYAASREMAAIIAN